MNRMYAFFIVVLVLFGLARFAIQILLGLIDMAIRAARKR